MKIGAVIVSSGYGTCRYLDGVPFPKVLEEVGNKPMIVRVADLVVEAGLAPRVVVVNPLFGDDIRATLREMGHGDCQYAVQPARRGAADAVLQAIPHLRETSIKRFLVIYADMPLWSSVTIRELVEKDRRAHPLLSMVTAELHGNYPKELERYGRVVRDETDAIRRVVEPADAAYDELQARTVNPSLWIWDREWCAAHVPLIRPYQRSDGYEPELHMPRLVAMVREEGGTILECPLADPQEALGVNTHEELVRVRKIFRARLNTSSGDLFLD